MLSRLMGRSGMLALALFVAAPAWAGQVPPPSSPAALLAGPELELRRQVIARFEVVPLKQGVALAGRTVDRRIEIDNGVVMASGVQLSGEELRQRLGADAALVLRLSYLDNAELRRLFAPAPPAPAAPDAPAAPLPPPAPAAAATPDGGRVYRRTGARLALAKSIVVAEDEDVTEAVIAMGGDVRVDGRVREAVVVVGGNLTLSPTAEVRGDITVLGGEVTIAPGARHIGQLHHGVAGRFPQWRWPAFGRSRVDLGPAGRVISLAGTLVRIVLLAVAVLLIAVFARGPVARIGAAASATPVRAGLIGLLTQVLFIPALIIAAVVLAVTIVGIPFVAVLIPLAVLALLAAMLLGFTSLAQRLGQSLAQRLGWSVEPAVLAAVLGMAVIVLPTFVARLVGLAPDSARAATFVLFGLGATVEYVAWTIGLGAAVMTGLGRWAVVPPPVPRPFVSDVPAGL